MRDQAEVQSAIEALKTYDARKRRSGFQTPGGIVLALDFLEWIQGKPSDLGKELERIRRVMKANGISLSDSLVEDFRATEFMASLTPAEAKALERSGRSVPEVVAAVMQSGKIKLRSMALPGKGSCTRCGAKHGKDQPHEATERISAIVAAETGQRTTWVHLLADCREQTQRRCMRVLRAAGCWPAVLKIDDETREALERIHAEKTKKKTD